MQLHPPMSLLPLLRALLVLVGSCLATLCFGQEVAAEQATAIVPGSELESMTGPLLRMIVSLAVVLALVGVFAWLAKRFRGGQMQGGLIQIVSGLSLGPKDRVVLLRVGQEEVLVGVSPAGMRALHVMQKPTSATAFSLGMAERADAKPAAAVAEAAEQG